MVRTSFFNLLTQINDQKQILVKKRQKIFDNTKESGRKHLMMLFLLFLIPLAGCEYSKPKQKLFVMPMMAGEVSSGSVILQARLTARDTIIYDDIHDVESVFNARVQGKEGWVRFYLSDNIRLEEPIVSEWRKGTEESDYIIKENFTSLLPATKYYYLSEFGTDKENTYRSKIQSFQTLPSEDESENVSFVMVTGSHLDRFYLGGGFGKPSLQGADAYTAPDKYLGFPAFEAITELEPDFFIGNGDNVYYDHPPDMKSKTREELRANWQRQFSMPRIREMFAQVPTFWMLDDHDHRFDDSDTVAFNERFGLHPSHELAMETWMEQLPLTTKSWEETKLYRRIRAGKDLELWLVEGRAYRSPNRMPDGPDKSIWGEEQKNWLKSTLKQSDATFKVLVTPTPMVGPDDGYKSDNHTNPDGFRYEGDAFFDWLTREGFLEENFYIICGDRHWKYHSVHPSGFEEISCGAMVDQNSRIGREPGDPKSTDPEGEIVQLYSDPEPTGGFLHVETKPENAENLFPSLVFTLYDDEGSILYQYTKNADNGL
ncbi:MAG: alkaline phosphatase D family protein [Bacteroidales bacterium]